MCDVVRVTPKTDASPWRNVAVSEAVFLQIPTGVGEEHGVPGQEAVWQEEERGCKESRKSLRVRREIREEGSPRAWLYIKTVITLVGLCLNYLNNNAAVAVILVEQVIYTKW